MKATPFDDLYVVHYHLNMKQKRAYHYRFYPTDEQAHILARTFGCARYVYNWALRLRTDAYYKEQKRIGYHETSAQLTLLKKQAETSWLNEVSSVPLQQALSHLDRAFRHFFEGHAQYPKFHTKRGDQSATYVASAFKWDGKQLTLAKMDAPLDIHWSRPLPTGAKPSSVTVSKDTAHRYARLHSGRRRYPAPATSEQAGRARFGPRVHGNPLHWGDRRQPQVLFQG